MKEKKTDKRTEKGEQKEKIRVAAYIRVSTEKESQETSFDIQKHYFEYFLQGQEEWVFVGIYSDCGISGTNRNKRTGFNRLLRHCEEGKIDRILCKSISRFARNTADFIQALEILEKNRVSICFEKEGLDTARCNSPFVLTALVALAQEESRSISENVRWGNEKHSLRGEVCNYEIYGYRFTDTFTVTETGYRWQNIEIVEDEAEVVRWIFGQIAQGNTYKAVARALNRRNIPKKVSSYTRKRIEHRGKGQLRAEIEEGWSEEQIRNIVKNERYTGDVLVQKTYTTDYLTHKTRKNKGERTQYLIQNHHPAIISHELFEQVKKIREIYADLYGKKERTGQRMLSGRLICARCGRFYHVRNTRQNPIWFCPSTDRENGRFLCKNEKVYENKIWNVFRKAFSERFCQIEGFERDMLEKMRERLIYVQQMDFVEWDRVFFKKQIEMVQKSICGLQEEIWMSTEKTQGKNKKENSRILCQKLKQEEETENMLKTQLNMMEEYWKELERGYEDRKRAIAWMNRLPNGTQGIKQFFQEVAESYMNAFVLSIMIWDSWHYTVHWFDDTKTMVKLDLGEQLV